MGSISRVRWGVSVACEGSSSSFSSSTTGAASSSAHPFHAEESVRTRIRASARCASLRRRRSSSAANTHDLNPAAAQRPCSRSSGCRIMTRRTVALVVASAHPFHASASAWLCNRRTARNNSCHTMTVSMKKMIVVEFSESIQYHKTPSKKRTLNATRHIDTYVAGLHFLPSRITA
jgi:hypothetical protein